MKPRLSARASTFCSIVISAFAGKSLVRYDDAMAYKEGDVPIDPEGLLGQELRSAETVLRNRNSDLIKTRGERLGTKAFQMVPGHVVTDIDRRNLVELIHYMLETERKQETAARQAGELLTMSRKLNEVLDS